MIFVKSSFIFLIIVGIYAVLDNMSLPIRFAIPMDVRKPDIGFWRAMEVYGNLGRFVVFSISSLLLYIGNFWLPLVLFAVMSFGLPVLVRLRVKGVQ